MKGRILVIEGTDFSGKTTQYEKLTKRLEQEGHNLGTESFPTYEKESSCFVRTYLSGGYGEHAADIDPKVASMFYAMNRFDSYKQDNWGKVYDVGGNILFARYISSNILHQASKYETEEEKKEFISWLYKTETEFLGVPKEDKVIFLNMPPEMAQKLKIKRLEEQHGLTSSGGVVDIHENDKEHLKKAYETAMWVAKELDWCVVDCVNEDGELKSIDTINNELYNVAKELFC